MKKLTARKKAVFLCKSKALAEMSVLFLYPKTVSRTELIAASTKYTVTSRGGFGLCGRSCGDDF